MENIKKLELWKSIILFGVPSLYFILLTCYGIPYLTNILLIHPALSWFITGYLVFVPLFALAIYLVMREKTIGFNDILERLRIKKPSKKDLLRMTGSTVLILALTGIIMAVSKLLAVTARIHELETTPSFMNFKAFQGNEKLYLLVWLPMFFFNIVGEEILWRGYILPRQELTHGNNAWLINSILWVAFHICFGIDLLIILLPTLFIIPYVAQKSKNTLIGIVSHALLNGPMFVLISLGMI